MATDAQTLINQVAAQGYEKLSKRELIECLLAAAQVGGGGGTPSYQDMQVAWTPSNLKLGELMGFFSDPAVSGGVNPTLAGVTSLVFDQSSLAAIDIENATDLVSISAPNLTSLSILGSYILVQACPVLVSASFPLLVSTDAVFSFESNPLQTTLNVPSWIPTPGNNYFLDANAFNVTTVDQILARCVASATWGTLSEKVDLSGGTNAAPSSIAPGSDYAILIGRGATVLVNP